MLEDGELAGDGGHAGVLGKVGGARLGEAELPQAQELLKDGLLDAELVKLGADVVDHVGDDAAIHGGLRGGGGSRREREGRGGVEADERGASRR